MRLSCVLLAVIVGVVAQSEGSPETFTEAQPAQPTQPTQPAQKAPHWSETCSTDLEVLCEEVLQSDDCQASRMSSGCKSLMFNCIDQPDQVVTTPCKEVIDARNALAASNQQKPERPAPQSAAQGQEVVSLKPACPPQPRPTCPLPAMHVRSARLFLKCVTFTKKGQFTNLQTCSDGNKKQNFALVPAVDGVKVLFSSSPDDLNCLNNKARLDNCGPDTAQSFRLVRTHIQSVQLQMVGTKKCLAAPKGALVLQDCLDLKQAKKMIRKLKAQSFHVEPTLALAGP